MAAVYLSHPSYRTGICTQAYQVNELQQQELVLVASSIVQVTVFAKCDNADSDL